MKTQHNSRKGLGSQPNWEELYKRALSDLARLENERSSDISRAELRAKAKVLQEFLPFVDDLERAQNQKENSQVVKLLLDKVLNILSLLKVSRLPNETGKIADPSTADIVSTVPGSEDGKIVEVVSQGYRLENLIVRPSRVIVSKRSLAK